MNTIDQVNPGRMGPASPAQTLPDQSIRPRNMHLWEELYPQEFMEILKVKPIVYFPFGIVEEHGTHLALGTDFLPPYRFCLAAVERTGGIVYPPLPAGPGGNPPLSRAAMREPGRNLCPPSLFVSAECCRQIYSEIMENMARMGFKICAAIGGHWPATKLLQTIVQEAGGKIDGMRVIAPNWSSWPVQRGIFKDFGGHGGVVESAVVRYCDPRLCDLTRVDEVFATNFKSQILKTPLKDPAKLREIAAGASLELGRKVFEAVVDGIVEAVGNEHRTLNTLSP